MLTETGHVTVSILFLIISANIYGRMLALSGITGFVGQWIGESGLGLYAVLEHLSARGAAHGHHPRLHLHPDDHRSPDLSVMKAFGVDFVWFGLVTVLAIEVGLITPPLGIAAYVVKSTLDDQRITLNDVFAGAPALCGHHGGGVDPGGGVLRSAWCW